MAHKKAAASTASQKGNRRGKRRGVKRYAGEIVTAGTILVKQVGSIIKAGANVAMGKDFTIFAKKPGVVGYKSITRNKKSVFVV